MKFHGTGIVWDGENNKVLCRFTDGTFETDDKRVQDILIANNFEAEPEKKKK